jgi:transcriptional regulator with XRE-family HTH domain
MTIFCHNADMAADIVTNLGKNLEFLRKSRGLTQSKLAKDAGMPRTTLSYMESGEGNPSLKNLTALAGALSVSIEELLSSPRPSCLLVTEVDLKRHVRARGLTEVVTLLPDPVPGLQFERLNLKPQSLMLGIPHSKGTREYFTCIKGSIAVAVEGEEFILEAGDVLAFPGDRKHSYKNLKAAVSQGISIVVLEK